MQELPEETAAIVRERVRGTWVFRTRAEIEASARFARLAKELESIGAQAVVVQGAREAADDEARHRDLCAALAAAWGAPNAKSYEPPRVRIGRADMEPRDRLLWEMVAVCCVGETMNTALMGRLLEVAQDEAIKGTLHELLKDEVRHSRLGWAHLAAERAAGRGEFLPDVLPLILEASVEPGFLDGTRTAPWTEELYAYGELPSSELVALYCEVIDKVVFPGFEALGVDTSQGRAWLEEHVKLPTLESVNA